MSRIYDMLLLQVGRWCGPKQQFQALQLSFQRWASTEWTEHLSTQCWENHAVFVTREKVSKQLHALFRT